uniref:Cytochrome P450 n=1 Tax=Plectus sambesii TaxID=2011161 RepID=A0A914VHG7_9BILA
MLLFVLFCLVVTSILARWILNRYNKQQLRDQLGIKGPPPNFFTGNLLQLIEFSKQVGLENGHKIGMEYAKQYGNVMGLYFGPELEIVVTDLEIAKEIFIKQFSNFVDRRKVPFNAGPPLSESLLVIGARGGMGGWKDVRSAVSPTFSSGKMKSMFSTVESTISIFMENMAEHAESGKSFDIYDEFQALTLDVIGKCAFAIDSNSLKNRDDPFYINCRKFFLESDMKRSWVIPIAFMFPELEWLITKIRPWTAFGRAEQPLVEGLRAVLEERKKNFNKAHNVDIIQLLLSNDEEHKSDTKKQPMTTETIVANCYAFLLAGYETTSTALAYTAWLLAKHTDEQRKLQEEIDEVLGDREMKYDDINKLPYLDAVFHESLRMYPPVIV